MNGSFQAPGGNGFRAVVSVHGRWHAFELANGLFRRGHLSRLLTTYPAWVARRFLEPGIDLRTAPILEVRRRLFDRWRVGSRPDAPIARQFAAFAACNLPEDADLLVGWSSATLEAISVAHDKGIQVALERGSTHIAHQSDVLRNAHEEIGIPYSPPVPEIVEREIAEYERCDAIFVPTAFAARTFRDRGVDAQKVHVNPYGVDLRAYGGPKPENVKKRPRILFVGSVGVRKGVPWLLKAHDRISARSSIQPELRLVGPVDGAIKDLARKWAGDNVIFTGALRGAALIEEYNRADLFCLPSLEEGFPLSTLQAMAAGLPVITTEEAGGGEIIRDGIEGRVVPARDIEKLADALSELIGTRGTREKMTEAVLARVRSDYTIDDYIDRAIRAYRQILDSR